MTADEATRRSHRHRHGVPRERAFASNGRAALAPPGPAPSSAARQLPPALLQAPRNPPAPAKVGPHPPTGAITSGPAPVHASVPSRPCATAHCPRPVLRIIIRPTRVARRKNESPRPRAPRQGLRDSLFPGLLFPNSSSVLFASLSTNPPFASRTDRPGRFLPNTATCSVKSIGRRIDFHAACASGSNRFSPSAAIGSPLLIIPPAGNPYLPVSRNRLATSPKRQLRLARTHRRRKTSRRISLILSCRTPARDHLPTMATDLIMPTLNTQQQSNYFLPPARPQHHRSQSYQPGPRPGVSYNGISSLSSSNSSGNSPTSPKPYMPRQRPLFIPAALRPNEFPSKPVPVPKTSLSEDSTPVGSLTRSGTGLLSLAGSALSTLTRRSTGDSGKMADDGDDENELDTGLFPDVTALPKRTHWKVCTSSRRRFRSDSPARDATRRLTLTARSALQRLRRPDLQARFRLLHPPPSLPPLRQHLLRLPLGVVRAA